MAERVERCPHCFDEIVVDCGRFVVHSDRSGEVCFGSGIEFFEGRSCSCILCG